MNTWCFPGDSSGKEPPATAREMRHRFDPWIGKFYWRRACQLTPVFLPGESHGQRSLVGCSPWGYKESGTTEQLTLTYMSLSSLVAQLVKNLPAMQEPRVRSLGREDPLEKKMATHSSTPLPGDFQEQRS